MGVGVSHAHSIPITFSPEHMLSDHFHCSKSTSFVVGPVRAPSILCLPFYPIEGLPHAWAVEPIVGPTCAQLHAQLIHPMSTEAISSHGAVRVNITMVKNYPPPPRLPFFLMGIFFL